MSLLSNGLRLSDSPEPSSVVYKPHPIRDAHAPESRGMPLFLSLCVTPLAVYAFSAGVGMRAPFSGIRQPGRAVPLSLSEQEPSADVLESVQSRLGLREAGGAGHTEGTSALDPHLADTASPTLSQPTEPLTPGVWTLAPRADQIEVPLNPALPREVGGNGLVRGIGQEASVGSGDLNQPLQPIPDHRLVLVWKTSMKYRLISQKEVNAIQSLKVLILIGDDGVPFQATVLSGPTFLHDRAKAAALGWRFEPLRPHGLKGPVSLVLVFNPIHLGPQ